MIEVPNFYDLKDISNEWEDNAAKIIKIMKNIDYMRITCYNIHIIYKSILFIYIFILNSLIQKNL